MGKTRNYILTGIVPVKAQIGSVYNLSLDELHATSRSQ